MNDSYFYDYVDIFERVLSAGIHYEFSLPYIERSVSYSQSFKRIEDNDDRYPSTTDEDVLMKELFPDFDVNLLEVPVYSRALWAAEAYMHIQLETKLTFEAIFLYLPLYKMYRLFPVYHEMDFSHTVLAFNENRKKENIISILLKRMKYTIKYVSDSTGIPYSTLADLKHNRRDIRKMNVESVAKLARIFNVRIETISELTL